ncbi:10806_t:CDS:2 [Diversispora eburnea]|uniref:Phosphatidylglycerol/phosphatidylinositol transfer protein n=1 Tax=Diversispora eburnea TaxID=1213867 RepID=A0A9N9BG47_9GLOM|nr:10806_t:CDS:2 [Diversispora eburnea]
MPCRPSSNLLTVKLSPDPIVPGKTVAVTMSGTLAVDVPADPGSTLAEVAFLDTDYVPVIDPFSTDFCASEGIKCPIPAGTEFSTVLNVPVPASADLPSQFEIVVDIKDGKTEEFLGCALSDVLSPTLPNDDQ